MRPPEQPLADLPYSFSLSVIAPDKLVLFCTTAADKPHWTRDVLRLLVQGGYDVRIVEDAREALHLTKQRPVAALLATESREALTLFAAILREINAPPLLVLVTENLQAIEADTDLYAQADLVLPAYPHHIMRQLETVLALQSENVSLQQRLQDNQQQMNNVQLLKNALVRTLSHELRTPLLQVKSAVSLISEDSPDAPPTRLAKQAVARLETLISNITMLGSTLDHHPSQLILRDTIYYAYRNLERLWESKGKADRIQLHVEPNLPPVYADKDGLSKVLQLLMDNALKFSEAKNTADKRRHAEGEKPVIVTAVRQGDSVRIAVCDQGIGIPPQLIERIFDLFYQVDSTSTRKYSGAGIGLALVKLILDRHNTRIEVESELGKGSCFAFSLPLAQSWDAV
jgi:signal transduction histidine kinase